MSETTDTVTVIAFFSMFLLILIVFGLIGAALVRYLEAGDRDER